MTCPWHPSPVSDCSLCHPYAILEARVVAVMQRKIAEFAAMRLADRRHVAMCEFHRGFP
ncbi:MAG: hypothetical protein ACREDE_09995 [Thermoplasmata archaeon]